MSQAQPHGLRWWGRLRAPLQVAVAAVVSLSTVIAAVLTCVTFVDDQPRLIFGDVMTINVDPTLVTDRGEVVPGDFSELVALAIRLRNTSARDINVDGVELQDPETADWSHIDFGSTAPDGLDSLDRLADSYNEPFVVPAKQSRYILTFVFSDDEQCWRYASRCDALRVHLGDESTMQLPRGEPECERNRPECGNLLSLALSFATNPTVLQNACRALSRSPRVVETVHDKPVLCPPDARVDVDLGYG